MSKSFVPTERDLSRRAILNDLDQHLKVQAARLHILEERTRIVSDQSTTVNPTQDIRPQQTTYDILADKFHQESANDSEDNEPLVVKLSKQMKLSQNKSRAEHPPTNKLDGGGDVTAKILSTKKSGRIVKKYDPSYTWNRGGRIKELRIRYRARKFFYIWRDRALGRVRPSRALQFYQERLKQRIWNIWISRYWIDYKEVRLNLRAVGHYRYLITSRYWSAWRMYIAQRKSQSAKMKLADKWHQARIVKRAFVKWRCDYPERQRVHTEMMDAAKKFRNQQLVKQAWAVWCSAMLKANVWLEKENEANRMYENKLKLRCLSQWQVSLKQHEEMKSRMLLAIDYNNGLTKDYYFRCWQLYVAKRKKHNTVKKRCDAHYRYTVLQRFSHAWIRALSRYRELQAMEERRLHLRNTSLMRLAMQRWKFYISIRDHEDQQRQNAADHFQFNLKRRYFKRIEQFRSLQESKRELTTIAARFRRKKLLLRSYELWMDKFEAKQEDKLFNKTRIARASRRPKIEGRMLLRVHFAKWREFVKLKSSKLQKVKMAEDHFCHRALPRCFHVWREYTASRIYKSELRVQADQHYRRNIVSIVWENWFTAVQSECEHRYLERVAVLHDRSRLMLSRLRLWLNRTKHLLKQKQSEMSAEEYRRRAVLKNSLKQWKLYVHVKFEKQQKIFQMEEMYRQTLLKSTFHKWRLFVATRLRYKMLLNNQRKVLQIRIMKRTFTAWKQITQSSNDRRAVALKIVQKKSFLILKSFWSAWKEGIQAARKRTVQTSLAHKHCERGSLIKIFHAWREFTMSHKSKKENTLEQVVIARAQLNQSIARHFLHRWMARRDGLLLERLAMNRSIIYHDRICLTKYLSAWRSCVVRKQNERLLKRQADWLCEKRRLGNVWCHWRWSLSVKIHLKKQSVRALWHWSLSLQSRVWAAWRESTLLCRHRKQRENAALYTFRNSLLSDGLSQWATVAWQIRRERESAALTNMKYLSPKQISAALKYGIHWRQTVLKKRGSQAGMLLACSYRMHPLLPEQAVKASPARLPFAALTIQSAEFESVAQTEPSSLHGTASLSKKRPAPAYPDFMRSSLAREGLLEGDSSELRDDEENRDDLERVVEEPTELLNQVDDDYLQLEEELLPPQFFLNEKITDRQPPNPVKNNFYQERKLLIKELSDQDSDYLYQQVNQSNSSPMSQQSIIERKELSQKSLIGELKQIKSRLKSYHDSREYMKSLNCKVIDLTEILNDQSLEPNDPILLNLLKEIDSLNDEKKKVKSLLENENRKCKVLSVRAQEIIVLLKH